MEQKEELLKLVQNNRQHIEEDGYLSFEEVGSIDLHQIDREQEYRWIDGVQLLSENGEEHVKIWVSTNESLDIYSIDVWQTPSDILQLIIDKVNSTIAYEKSFE